MKRPTSNVQRPTLNSQLSTGRASTLGCLLGLALVLASTAVAQPTPAPGFVAAWGTNALGQLDRPLDLEAVIAVDAGFNHVLALRANHTVAAWGDNHRGQCAVPSDAGEVVAVSAGYQHSVALRADGSVRAWGDNRLGQTSVPSEVTNLIAIAAGHRHSLARLEDGRVVTWGGLDGGTLAVPEGLAGVRAMAAGSAFSLALTPGPVFTRQPVGTLIVDGASLALTPIVAGREPFTFQWERDGAPIPGATGAVFTLVGAQPGDAADYTVEVRTFAGQAVSEKASLLVNPAPFLPGPAARGEVVVWGERELDDVAPPATLGEVAAVSTPILGTLSSAIRRDGSVVVWGYSYLLSFAVTGAVQVVTLGGDVLALMNNGIVEVLHSGGGDPPTWWSQLRGIRQLATAGEWLMALRTDGTLAMHPASDLFPSGLSNVVRIAAGYNHAAVVLGDGTVVMLRGLPTPPDLTNAIDVACGYEHTLALRRDGTVSAWGAKGAAQCDVPADLRDAIAIAAGGGHSLALRANGQRCRALSRRRPCGESVRHHSRPRGPTLLPGAAVATTPHCSWSCGHREVEDSPMRTAAGYTERHK